MEITNYENLAGETMVLIIDSDANTSESMPKAEYDRRVKEAKEAKLNEPTPKS